MAIFLFIRPLAWPSVGRMLWRPYTGDLRNGDFSIHSASGMAVCRAYAIRPYPTGRKFIGVSVCFYPGNEIIVIFSGTRVGAYCIRPTNGHANGQMDGKMDGVSVRFYPGKTKMAGDSMDRHPRKGVWGCPILVVRFLDHMPGLHFEITVDYIDG